MNKVNFLITIIYIWHITVSVKHFHMTIAFIPQKNFGEFARNMTDYLNKETSNMLLKEKRTKGMNRSFLYKEKTPND